MMAPAMDKFTAVLFVIILAASISTRTAAQINEEHAAAPEISAEVWINSPPLTLSRMRGKVLLIDFWEYTCIDCIRTFPYLKRWHSLYAPLGLVVIGVHTPEFAFAKDPQRIADAVKRFGLTFPVAVDSDARIWKAFHNDARPAEYLIDQDGHLEYSHAGEGEDAQFERLIQQLLRQVNPKLDFSAPRYNPPPEAPGPGAMCRQPTSETYLGFLRSDRLANSEGYQQLNAASYRPVVRLPLDQFDISGQWLAMPENIQHVGPSRDYDHLRLHYHAKSVYLVAGSEDGVAPGLVLLSQDGEPLATGARGVDVKAGADRQTYLSLGGKRMYYLVENPLFGEHVLDLEVSLPEVSFYSFTFGGNCEPAFDHR